MTSARDWDRGEGLPALDDPEEWDAVYVSVRDHVGRQGVAWTAALPHGEPIPELYDALRSEEPRGFAETDVDDTLSFVQTVRRSRS
ncbi:hypothetical protein RKD23_003200 [Streptomyces sp. SAI-170]|uniref:hypothetical protein n=1 Tax=Streptomyces sp. SAI-170 TaxID=3377729 RepID=UPI003C7AF130